MEMYSNAAAQGSCGDSSDGSAYVSCHGWNFRREESLNNDHNRNSSLENRSDSSGYLEVRQTRNNDSGGYLEVRSARNVDSGYRTSLTNENELTILFNPNGDLVDIHGYIKLFDEEPNNSIQGEPYRVPLPTKKVVACIPKEKYEGLKSSNIKMKRCIVFLVGLFLAALLAFLLTWFRTVTTNDCQDCPHDPENHSAFSCPLIYSFSLGKKASIRCVLPKLTNYSHLVVDLYKTKVRYQDTRLLQVDDVYIQDSSTNESERISTRISASKEYISIMIDIHVIQCDDHGYIAINISGGLVVSIRIDVTVPSSPCPEKVLFQWNKTELISCSACVGNAIWNMTWYREGKSNYIPVLENSTFLLNGSNKRIVSLVEFAFGVVHFKLLNQRVFCSDGGNYSASLYTDHVEHYFTTIVDVNGSIESCTNMWDITLIDFSSKACSFCIGDIEDLLNISITQENSDISKSESMKVLQGEYKEIKFRDFLTIETNIYAGMITVLFRWSRVQCIDNGIYRIEARFKNGMVQRNISIAINELPFLKPPKIVQQDGVYGGFADGFNLSLKCNVESMGCKQHDIYLSLPGRNTTSSCRKISLGTANINESYECSLAWTELNISRDFNGTSFYCGYNYTHYNGTLLVFQETMHVFVIPGNLCRGYGAKCQRPHPLGGELFIECDALVYNRPWERHCNKPLVFSHGPGECDGHCEYPTLQIPNFL